MADHELAKKAREVALFHGADLVGIVISLLTFAD
jgi:hypothetical protein